MMWGPHPPGFRAILRWWPTPLKPLKRPHLPPKIRNELRKMGGWSSSQIESGPPGMWCRHFRDSFGVVFGRFPDFEWFSKFSTSWPWPSNLVTYSAILVKMCAAREGGLVMVKFRGDNRIFGIPDPQNHNPQSLRPFWDFDQPTTCAGDQGPGVTWSWLGLPSLRLDLGVIKN